MARAGGGVACRDGLGGSSVRVGTRSGGGLSFGLDRAAVSRSMAWEVDSNARFVLPVLLAALQDRRAVVVEIAIVVPLYNEADNVDPPGR